MSSIPKKIKLSKHAKIRLDERKEYINLYFRGHLMDSPCIWYEKEEFIIDSDYYRHCEYICRKSSELSCMTDGRIEIIYNKKTNVVITVLKMKKKFLPFQQYLIKDKAEENRNIVMREEGLKRPMTIAELMNI